MFDELLDKKGTAIINVDETYGKKIKMICDVNNITNFTYGFKEDCDWRIIEINRLQKYTEVVIKNKNKNHKFRCKLIADYEIENLLAAIILANKNGLFFLGGKEFGSSYKDFYRFCFEKNEQELKKIIKIMDKYEIY